MIVNWIKENRPPAGEAGSACSAQTKCTDAAHCCGTLTPAANAEGATEGEVTGACADKETGTFTNAILGIEYTHICGAKQLIASSTALLAAAFSLM